jgi:hypothetical protein
MKKALFSKEVDSERRVTGVVLWTETSMSMFWCVDVRSVELATTVGWRSLGSGFECRRYRTGNAFVLFAILLLVAEHRRWWWCCPRRCVGVMWTGK